MTEQNKKRTLKEFYNADKTDITRKRIKGPEQSKPVSIKEAKQKAKKVDEPNHTDIIDPEPEVASEELLGYQDTHSLFALCTLQPSQLKKSVDDLLLKGDSQGEVMRVIFLYFFQMAGVSKDDHATFSVLFEFLERKNANANKPKEMTKAQQDSLKFDVDQAAIFGQGKLAMAHLRHFRKFCKLLVANLVDLYPAKKELLVDIAREVCIMSRLRIRLVRYAFTSIGMQLLKNLLAQKHSLDLLSNQFKTQPSAISSQIETLDHALDYVSDKLVGYLARELV